MIRDAIVGTLAVVMVAGWVAGHANAHPDGRVDRVLVWLLMPAIRAWRKRKRRGDGLTGQAILRHREQARWN